MQNLNVEECAWYYALIVTNHLKNAIRKSISFEYIYTFLICKKNYEIVETIEYIECIYSLWE